MKKKTVNLLDLHLYIVQTRALIIYMTTVYTVQQRDLCLWFATILTAATCQSVTGLRLLLQENLTHTHTRVHGGRVYSNYSTFITVEDP